MAQYDNIEQRQTEVDRELREKIEPYKHLVAKLKEIPGVDDILAVGIIAEATTDMTRFGDERKFAAWAGVASGNNESGGKKKDQNVARATHICAKF